MSKLRKIRYGSWVDADRPVGEKMLKSTVQNARAWFMRFGHMDDCISETGRNFFRFLLEKAEAAEALAGKK